MQLTPLPNVDAYTKKTLAGLTCIFFLTACMQPGSDNKASNSQTDDTEKRAREEIRQRLSEGSFSSDTLLEAKKRLENEYRLKPDRRFLLAAERIYSFFNPQDTQAAVAVWSDNHWQVSIANREIFSLSEFPSHEEMMGALTSWTKQLVQSKGLNVSKSHVAHSELQKKISAFAPKQLFSVLEECGNLWASGEHSTVLIEHAADASTLLSLQSMDLLQVADALPAQAMALSAIDEAYSSRTNIPRRCLLAYSLSYFDNAREYAGKLPAQEPIRLFLDGRKPDLPSTDGLSAYLSLLHCSQTRDKRGFLALVQSDTTTGVASLSMLKACSEAGLHEWLMPISLLVAKHTLDGVKNHKEDRLHVNQIEWNDSEKRYEEAQGYLVPGILAEFESVLKERRAIQEQGLDSSFLEKAPFFDPILVDSYYRGYFYSSMDLLSQCYSSMPSAQVFCERFADSLKVPENSNGKKLEEWFKDRIMFRAGKRSANSLEHDLTTGLDLGPSTAIDLFTELARAGQKQGIGQLLSLGRTLFERCDTRPENIWQLAQIADEALLDLKLNRKLLITAGRYGMPPGIDERALGALLLNDRATLKRLLQESKLQPIEEVELLKYMEQCQAYPNSALTKRYQNLVHSRPHQWFLMEPFYKYLLGTKQLMFAQKELSDWIGRQNRFAFQDEARARTALAHVLSRQGKHKQALAELAKLKDCTLEIYLHAKIKALLGAGSISDASSWAKENLSLHRESTDAVILMAETLWRKLQYGEAAQLLAQNQRKFSRQTWRSSIGPVFVECFATSSAGMLSAIYALAEAGLAGPDNVGQLAHALYIAHKPDKAFEAMGCLKPSKEQLPDAFTTAYRYLKEWKSKKYAQQWLSEHVSIGDRKELAPFAFISGQTELLWDFIPIDSTEADFVWRLRAAANAVEHDPSRKQALEDHFAHSSDEIGKYQLDAKLLNRVLSKKLEEGQLAQDAFYVGWKMFADGIDIADGAQWYRVALQPSSQKEFEYSWSWRWLGDIQLARVSHSAVLRNAGRELVRVVPPQETGDWEKQRRYYLVFGR